MTFAARQQMRTHLFTTFVDRTKAFDTVNCGGLWKVEQKFSCPKRFAHMSHVLCYADGRRDEQPEIRIAYTTDGNLLNSWRMQAPTRMSTATVQGLLFADDYALNTVTEEDIQRSMDLFATGCANF
ncbi:unnamed protein product [Schistocephalus solidus]|uniref:Reverse transcriptase domain-containing protein n=1 Tax=Schistocephalus solidus TaxID=70667 RepID=A0A183SJQ9_SCHSO|nr:unnamed protein product [Schistocephalus solidus]